MPAELTSHAVLQDVINLFLSLLRLLGNNRN